MDKLWIGANNNIAYEYHRGIRMSCIIKGYDLPDSCLNCRFRTTMLKNVLSSTMRTSVYTCLISGMKINIWYEEKHKDCPLVEIPTTHGRLIDADEIEKCVHEWYDVGEYVFADVIRNSDTIIEAEVSE